MILSELTNVLIELNDGVIILNEYEEVVYIEGEINKHLKIKKSHNLKEVYFEPLREVTPGEVRTEIINGQQFIVKMKEVNVRNINLKIITLNKASTNSNAELRVVILEQILNSLNEGIVASDHEGKFLFYNKAQEKLENLKSEEVLGKYLWDVYRIDPKTSEHRNVYNTKHPIIGQYRAHAYTQGIPQYTTYNTYPLLKDNQAIGAFSVCMNDTKLKDLLHETIELKRKLYKNPTTQKEVSSNGTTFKFDHIKGESAGIRDLIKEAQNMSLYNTDILIVGETGTGKELFAQSIHNHSPRSKNPFIAVNCAAIPETLLESTLFGSMKGAYTGAIDQVGLFEYAQNGTLFLDEINSMPMSLQSKLIRVLEERKVRRVGSNELKSIHCNIITASNEDPQVLIKDNRLRLDLYYRIAKICLIIPPLRERPEDITFYINYFMKKFNNKFNKNLKGATKMLEQLFLQYCWPGNTRELEHVVENLVIRTNDNEEYIDVAHLPINLRDMLIGSSFQLQSTRGEVTGSDSNNLKTQNMRKPLEEQIIKKILENTNWNITQAAIEMGISRQNLQYHIKKLNLKRPRNS